MVIDELPRGVNFFLKLLKGSCIYLAIILLKNDIELSSKVPYETVIFPRLMYYHPILAYVNSKSLLITLAYPENRRGSS